MYTTYFLNLVAGNVTSSKTSPALPQKLYLGLSSTAPEPDGSGVTEPISGGYRRVELTNLSAPEDGVVINSKPIYFDESTGSWGLVTHYGVFDAESGGNLLIYGKLNPSHTVKESAIMTIRTGALKFAVENSSVKPGEDDAG